MNSNFNFPKYGFPLGIIFIFSYVLTFLWESFFCALIYQGHSISSQEYFLTVGGLSFIDAWVNVFIYLAVGFLLKNFFWCKETNLRQILTAVAVSLVFGAGVEYFFIYVFKVWKYYAYIPTVFGIGLLPLAQFGVIEILAVWMAKRLINST